MTQKRFFFLVSGCIGIVLLILPTVPFFLLTVFCFANSSQKLHDWFIGTKMYRKHLEFFVQRKDMTRKAKSQHPHLRDLPDGAGVLLHDSKGPLNSPAVSLRLCGSAT